MIARSTDGGRPHLLTRVRAAWHGEQSAAAVRMLRDAGQRVSPELDEAERARAAQLATGLDPWRAPRSAQLRFLAIWNAFALQTLGGALLDADTAADPGTAGYLPPATYRQCWAWLTGVAAWLSIARQAATDPVGAAGAQLALPAGLPPWEPVEPCPVAHLAGFSAAMPVLREHAELAVFALEKSGVPAERSAEFGLLRRLCAEAASAADYAAGLGAQTTDQRLHELIESRLQHAVDLWYQVGQLAAMPTLLADYRPPAAPTIELAPEQLPGGPRFDPWRLTDPATRDEWRADPRARQAIRALWAADPNPVATLTLHAQIERAREAGAISYLRTGVGGSCYFCCPWSPLYQVNRPVTLAGHYLHVAQQFTMDVSAEQHAEGGPFVRRIVTGPFQQTDQIDYCDPSEER